MAYAASVARITDRNVAIAEMPKRVDSDAWKSGLSRMSP